MFPPYYFEPYKSTRLQFLDNRCTSLSPTLKFIPVHVYYSRGWTWISYMLMKGKGKWLINQVGQIIQWTLMKTMICEEKIASRDERRVGRLIQEINKFYEFIIRNWTDEIRDTIIRPGDPQDFDSRENGFIGLRVWPPMPGRFCKYWTSPGASDKCWFLKSDL